MRLLIVSLFLVLTSVAAQAQWLTRPRVQNNQNFDKKPLSWGFYFGTNSLDFNFDYQNDQIDVEVQRSAGFNVGLLSSLRLSEFVDLRLEPGLVFSERTLLYAPDPRFQNDSDPVREVNATYIYLPLLLKINTRRLNNVRPFVTFGVATARNLSSNEDNPDDNFAGQFRTVANPTFYEIGVGMDFYLYFFKFTPSIKGVFAIRDELVKDSRPNSPWTDNINRLTSRGVFLTFSFQ